MKEGLFIKLNWLVYRGAILNHLAILSKENPKELYKKARRIYKREMKQLGDKGRALLQTRKEIS